MPFLNRTKEAYFHHRDLSGLSNMIAVYYISSRSLWKENEDSNGLSSDLMGQFQTQTAFAPNFSVSNENLTSD